jgi:DNA repair protein RadC
MSTDTIEPETIERTFDNSIGRAVRRERAQRFLSQASALFAAELSTACITDPEETAPWFRAEIGFNNDESFAAIFMDQGRRALKRMVFAVGSRTRTVLYPRQLFKEALDCDATVIILAHNHPGGSLIPSSQDRALTRKIQEIGESLEISLVDHLIVTKEGHASFCRHGWM